MTRRWTPSNRRTVRVAATVLAGLGFSGLLPSIPLLPRPQAVLAEVTNPSCWQVDVVPNDAAAQAGRDRFTDFLTFDNLGFTAEAMAKLGFPSEDVTIAADGTFSVTATSDAHGATTWAGTLSAGRIRGTLTWTRDGQTYVYNFTGVPFQP